MEQINRIIEALLKDDETDITYINHLIYAVATVITESVTTTDKALKCRWNEDSCKIRIQDK